MRGIFLIWGTVLFVSAPVYAHHGGSYAPSGTEGVEQNSITAAPLLTVATAGTLGRNRMTAGFAFEYANFDQIPAAEAHELHHRNRDVHGQKHEEIYTLQAGYGIIDDADLYLTAPIVSRASNQIHGHRGMGDDERASGFGDLRLTGKYRFWQKHVEAALIAGIKFPTGETSDQDSRGAKFDPEIQPGSGSWDGDFGMVFSRSFRRRLSAGTGFHYHLRTQGGQQYERGDLFRWDIGAAASVLKPLGQYPNLHAHLELNHEWALHDEHKKLENPDSGGTVITVTPGLNFALNPQLSVFAALPVPVVQNLGGYHEETEYRVLAGIHASV